MSTRKVDQVVESLGLPISKSEGSRICQGLDEQVDAFRNRPLGGCYPYLWLDAKVEKVRDGGRVVRKALVLAYGVHESGYREVIALDVGESETEAFWRAFLRGLVERGLSGVQLVISDAHAGLKKAIGQVLGCPWQRCSVHFLREALGHARREQQPMLAALLRPIFNADNGEQARQLVGDALERLGKPLPKVSALLEEAEEDLLAFYAFPADHWPKLRSTNPLERVNREIGRRTDVVGIFPNDRSLIRLAASVVIEQNDEWLVGRRYLSNHSLEAVLDQEKPEDKDTEEARELTAARAAHDQADELHHVPGLDSVEPLVEPSSALGLLDFLHVGPGRGSRRARRVLAAEVAWLAPFARRPERVGAQQLIDAHPLPRRRRRRSAYARRARPRPGR